MKTIFVWFFSLLLCIFSWSCFLPHTYHFAYVNSAHHRDESPVRVQKIYIDKEFGYADAVSIQDALDRWRYALNGYVEFKTETVDVVHGSLDPFKEARDGKAWLFLKIDSHNALVDFHDRPEHLALAFVERIGGNVMYIVRDRISNDSVRGVTMHEIGHLLGAEHKWDDENLMHPSYNDSDTQCIDKETLEQVAVYQHIPVGNMNYCVYTNDEKDNTRVIIRYVD